MRLFTICYISNHIRERLQFELDETAIPEVIFAQIDEKIQNLGYPQVNDRIIDIRLDNGEIVKFGQIDPSSNNIDEIIYASIVKTDNAYEYANEGGISYYFHTKEDGHKKYPHIHARLARGEEISIYFSNLRIVGKSKNSTKIKEAKRWVSNHLDELVNEWKRIMEQQ